MDPVSVDSYLDSILRSCSRSGRYSCGERNALAVEVQIGLSTHHFGNFYVSVDNTGLSGGEEHLLVVGALGTNAENDLLVYQRLESVGISLSLGNLYVVLNALGGLGVLGAELYDILAVLLEKNSVDEVHLRRADEARNELVYRIVVKVLRSIYLLDVTVFHNNDTVTHRHSLSLVMSNVDKGGTQSLMELGYLGSHLSTELSVEVGKRLVKKEYLRLTNYSTSESNTLSLTAGESLRLSVQQVSDVKYLSGLLDLTHLLDRKPKAMSGGQRQRVALGRAIVRSPKVFLLDEPLSNLDAKLRAQMRTEIAKIHKKLGTTFIYVTHDQTEAMTMGDRIVCMKDGFVQQIDTPQNLYENPVNKFVAGFLGSPQMNFIDAELKEEYGQYIVEFGATNGRGNRYQIIVPESKVNEDLNSYVGKEIVLGIRPESIHDEEMYLSNASTGVIDANVEITEMMGAETYLYLLCEGIPLTARVSPRSTARPGDDIKVAIDPNRIHIFDKETEKAIVN